MSPFLVSAIVFAFVYGGALLGFALRVPEHHRDPDSRDVLKAGSALIATMAALVLGLLVASAKSSYDNQREELVQICADVALLDRALAAYGPEAAESRRLLKTTVEAGFLQLWREASEPPTASGENLPAASERQRAIKALTGQLAIGLGRTRWLMHAQSVSSISTPLLVVVVFWLAILFVSFGIYAKPNATVHAALFVCALSVAGAIFLILEMDRPFDGLIRISDTPIRDIVGRLGH
jgi:hypothetical protein